MVREDTWTIRGLSAGLPLVAKMFAEACGSSASAPRP